MDAAVDAAAEVGVGGGTDVVAGGVAAVVTLLMAAATLLVVEVELLLPHPVTSAIANAEAAQIAT